MESMEAASEVDYSNYSEEEYCHFPLHSLYDTVTPTNDGEMNNSLQNEWNTIFLLIEGFIGNFTETEMPSDIVRIIYNYYPKGDDDHNFRFNYKYTHYHDSEPSYFELIESMLND